MDIPMEGRSLEIRLSRAAERALAARSTPLLAEMELLFSCLIRKQVRFGELTRDDAVAVSDRLSVRFRPVMTKVCSVAEVAGSPPVEDFPIADARPYIPRWLAIDYQKGRWQGEFGYGRGTE